MKSEMWSSRMLLVIGLVLITLGVIVMVVSDIRAGAAIGVPLSTEDIDARVVSSAVLRGLQLLLIASGALTGLTGAVAEGVRMGLSARAQLTTAGHAHDSLDLTQR